MKTKITTPEGKEIYATENVNDLRDVMLEALDQLRAGIIKPQDAQARASLGNVALKCETTKIMVAKLEGAEIDSDFVKPAKQIAE